MTAADAIKLVDPTAKVYEWGRKESGLGYWVAGNGWETGITYSADRAWELATAIVAVFAVKETAQNRPHHYFAPPSAAAAPGADTSGQRRNCCRLRFVQTAYLERRGSQAQHESECATMIRRFRPRRLTITEAAVEKVMPMVPAVPMVHSPQTLFAWDALRLVQMCCAESKGQYLCIHCGLLSADPTEPTNHSAACPCRAVLEDVRGFVTREDKGTVSTFPVMNDL